MIRLTRINGRPVVINSDLIEHIESTPDTVVSLTTKQSLMVLETVDEVVDRIVDFRRRVFSGAHIRTDHERLSGNGRRAEEDPDSAA